MGWKHETSVSGSFYVANESNISIHRITCRLCRCDFNRRFFPFPETSASPQAQTQPETAVGDNLTPEVRKVVRVPVMAPRPRNEPMYAAPMPDQVSDPQTAAHQGIDTGATVRTNTELSRTKRKRPTLRYQTLVQHTVSAVVSWSTDCGDAAEKALSYVIRYNPIGQAANYVDKIVQTNFVVLNDLRPNVKYHYQIKYVLDDLTETAWSNVGVLDTTYTEDSAKQ